MNRRPRIIVRPDSFEGYDLSSDENSWGEQPPTYVPGEILIVDPSKVSDAMREARCQGKTFILRKSALVGIDAAIVGIDSTIGSAGGSLGGPSSLAGDRAAVDDAAPLREPLSGEAAT